MENLYLDPLSLESEIPRLSAQAKMLFAAQGPFLARNAARLNVESNGSRAHRFLDAGAGNGVLTSLISKNFFPGYEIHAVDSSEVLINLTSITFPRFNWHAADITELPLDDESFDFSMSSYVLIHLRNPLPALKELRRVTKPGGLIYIINPADSKFRGSDVIVELVRKHAEIYEGDRHVMDHLEKDAAGIGLELLDSEIITVDNKGSDDGPDIGFPHCSLGRMTAWSMLSYMGQRSEVSDLFEQCQKEYMLDRIDFEAEIHLHLYGRP